MNKSNRTICVIVVVMTLCLSIGILLVPSRDTCQEKGFRLPPGSTEAGAQAFADLHCMECHTVAGSMRFSKLPENPDLHVELGGKVHVVKTYGELVTAIIHPSESIRREAYEKYVDSEGKSLMPDLTNQMTTRQLIDLVTYLQVQYDLVIPNMPANYYPNAYNMP